MKYFVLLNLLIIFGILKCVRTKLAWSCAECNTGASKLVAVSMITRHGDRAPALSYPLDPHANYTWPGGLGALSPRGADQLYQSGLYKSTRYSPLLSIICSNGNCTYDLSKIYVLSSPIQRCIDSVNSFLDAFLPIERPANLINVIPAKEDEMLVDQGKPCPKYPEENYSYGDVSFDAPQFTQIIDFNSPEGEEFKSSIKNNTGMNLTSPLAVLVIEDTLLIERDNDLQWPECALAIYDKYLMPLSNAAFDAIISRKLGELRSGVLLKDMVDRLANNVDEFSEQNILLYSAHDTTIGGLLNVLQIKNQTTIRPSYGAVLSMELYENGKIRNDFEIKILYFMNYGDTNPIEIQIPNCKTPCPFKTFQRSIQLKITMNYEAACAL